MALNPKAIELVGALGVPFLGLSFGLRIQKLRARG